MGERGGGEQTRLWGRGRGESMLRYGGGAGEGGREGGGWGVKQAPLPRFHFVFCEAGFDDRYLPKPYPPTPYPGSTLCFVRRGLMAATSTTISAHGSKMAWAQTSRGPGLAAAGAAAWSVAVAVVGSVKATQSRRIPSPW